MDEPSAVQLLDAWERGYGAPPEASAVALLGATASRHGVDSLIDLPIGERDRRLIALRERLFGNELSVALTCEACGESLEMTFETDAIRVPSPEVAGTVHATIDGRALAFRLPTTRDVLSLASVDVDAASRELVGRCSVDGTASGLDLSDTQIEAIGDAMEAADPQADVRLDTTCVSCGSDAHAVFDIVAHLRTEVEAWAMRTLHEVASLAAAYGWSERDILSMSAWRRQAYLRAVGG